MNTSWIKKRSGVLLAVSLGITVLLTIEMSLLEIQNRKLESTIEALTSRPKEPIKAGELVQPFKVLLQGGDTTTIGYNDSSESFLLFILSPGCPHCSKNLGAWNKIAEAEHRTNLKIVGVLMGGIDDTRAYAASNNVHFYLAAVGDTSFVHKYKIVAVPETILVDGKGVVGRVWMGELQQTQTEEIIELIRA